MKTDKNIPTLLRTKGHETHPPTGPERGVHTNQSPHHYRSSSETIRTLNYDNYMRPVLWTSLKEFALCLRESQNHREADYIHWEPWNQ